MKLSVADKCNLIEIPVKKELYGFSSTVEVNRIVCAKLTFESVVLDSKFCVVSENLQQTDILIGRPFTEHKDIAYATVDDQLIFGYRYEYPFTDMIK